MRDISNKIETLRSARAQSIIRVSPESIRAIKEKTVPKGDVLEMAKVAGFMAVKRTHEVIPHCHPIPVDSANVEYQVGENEITAEVAVQSIYKTGCEMEALYGASVVTMTLYDLLKPIDDDMEIVSTKLLEKKGGKSDFTDRFRKDLRAGVIVISDAVSAGKKKDKAGKIIKEKLESLEIKVTDYHVIPDEPDQISKLVREWSDKGLEMVITTGGTGFSPRDVTPEAVIPELDTQIPGIMDAAREYGQKRTPYAMLSRSIAGLRGNTLVISMPGSSRGAAETTDALFPYVLHIFRVITGRRH